MPRRVQPFLLILIALIAFTAYVPLISQAPTPVAHAASNRVYIPLMPTGAAPARFIGLATNQVSLQTYDDAIQNWEAGVGVNVALFHTPVAWSYEFSNVTSNFTLMNGSIPFIAWESGDNQTSGGCQPNFSLQNILNGAFDTYIRNYARGVADWGHTIFIDYGAEMNLTHAWSGYCNGGANGGPQRYVQVYRHIHDIFEQEGATNVQWVWTPAPDDFPKEDWNRMENYFPGADYVDWLGMKAFNWGASSSYNGHRWLSFDQIIAAQIDRIQAIAPGKPMIATETGSVDGDGGNRTQWIQEMFDSLQHYPQVKAVIYYNYTFPSYSGDGKSYDFAITNDAAAKAAFGTGVKKYQWSQHMYDSLRTSAAVQQEGQGAALGAELAIPPMDTLTVFNQATGKTHSVVTIYGDWSSISAWDTGSGATGFKNFFSLLPEDVTPLLMWQPNNIPLSDIASGAHDDFINNWAAGVKDWDRPLYIAWAPAPNNNQSCQYITWCGANNGGPPVYIAAWRHIVDVFRNHGVTNVRWTFMPNYVDTMTSLYYSESQAWKRSDSRWNAFYNYYPGDNYVDWIGIDVFNSGNNVSWGTYWSPAFVLFEPVLGTSARLFPTKPQLVLMTTVEEAGNPGHKAGWIRDAYNTVKTFPKVQLVIWKETFRLTGNGSITSSPVATSAYIQAITDPYFRSTAP